MNPPRLLLLSLLAFAALLAAPAPRACADAYDAMRINWFNNLTGGTSYDATDPDVAAATASLTNAANGYWTTLKATRPFTTTPFSDIALGSNSDNITAVYSRLETMCLAYWAIGGSLYQNATLKSDIITTLDWLNTNVYNATSKQYGNWFTWNIGTPLNLNNITVLLYDSLSATQIANYMNAINRFTPTPTTVATSGANCAWCTSIVGLRGVIVKDATRIAAASSQFSALTTYVTSPDGFYTDGSYIGHGTLSYNGGYGLYMLQQLADGYYLFNPTALSPLPASKRAVVYGWVVNSYQALMYQGKIPYYAIGREISRGPSDGRGEAISATVAELAADDTTSAATPILGFAKNVFAASGSNYSGLGGTGSVIRMKGLMSNAAIPAAAQPVGSTVFSVMAKETTLQSGWGASVSFYSTKICNYESINGEDLKGWHLSDGLLYLDNADWNQYNGTFWATVNSQRLPGTTVTAGSTLAQGLKNGSTFAGGATLNDLYATVGFTLQPGNGQTLVANKSWFIFDDEVVCLGSGITSTDGTKVETIVENRKLAPDGSNLLTVNGTAQPLTLPWTATQTVQWMHLAGTVTGADIGYYFPTAANLDFTREARSGQWSDIGVGPSGYWTDNYLTVGDSHGTSPTAAAYSYVLLPNYSAAQVAAYAVAPVASILENDANVSAVYNSKLQASGIVFWQDQSSQVQIDAVPTTVSSDHKATVMTRDAGSQFTIAVSDPTQANTGPINVTVSRPFVSVASSDSAITVTQLSPTLKMTVAVSGARGQMFQAVFNDVPAVVAPQITSAASADGTVGQAFSYQIVASNTPTGYMATGLPAGLTLDTSAGVISGTPTASGSFSVALGATNSGGTGTATLALTIAAQAVPAPQITSGTAISIDLGQAISYQMTASNSPTGYTATGLPAGLTFAADTGLISGTPAAAGSYSVVLGAANAGGTGTATLTINVMTPLPVVTVVATAPVAVVGGAPGTFTVTRTGDTSAALIVFYQIKGSGANGVDYVTMHTHAKIKAGQASKVIRVTPLGDLEGAAKRTVKLVLSANPSYSVGAASTAKVKIEPAN